MAGVRIHHPTLRSCTLLLWEPEHKDPRSQGGVRKAKKRPLLIDENGDSIVSETVWQRLQQAYAQGRIAAEPFIVLNEIPDPPKLVVSNRSATQHAGPTFEAKIGDAIRQIAPEVTGFHIESSTKYRPPVGRKD